jgi:hypothetical protein
MDPFDPFRLYELALWPYCWYGLAPTLFDAPSRGLRWSSLEWIAHSFLAASLLRGYSDPPPETLIVVGSDGKGADDFFSSCKAAATVKIPYGAENEIARDHPVIFLCRGLKMPWPHFWEAIKTYS